MKIPKLFILLSILFFYNLSVFAQSGYIAISGTIKDSKKQPLAFANVFVIGKSVGTISNQLGEFTFNVPVEYMRDTLSISFVGFKSFKGVVKDVVENNIQEYMLDENIIELKPITILDGQTQALDIINKAIKNFGNVYQKDPFVLESFYREWEVLQNRASGGKKQASIVEAALRIFDKGYTTKPSRFLKETVYLMEVRKIQAAEHDSGGTEFGWVLKQNPVNYRRDKAHFFVPGVFDTPNKLEYELAQRVTLDDEELYVITAYAADFLATYTIYISTEDYALLRVDLHAKSDSGKFVHHAPNDNRYRVLSIDNTMRFRRVDGKPFVNYIRMNWVWEKVDSLNNREESGELYKEILVNQVYANPPDVERIKDQTKVPPIKPGESLFDKVRPYNTVFWDNYNVIKENSLDKELAEALAESGKSINENFKEKSGTKNRKY